MGDPMETIEDILGKHGSSDDIAARGDEMRDRQLTRPRRTAAETIQAAIDKLERLSDAAPSEEVNGWLARGVWPEPNNASGYVEYKPLTNDELIVTLHRTIDAQLIILRSALVERPARRVTGLYLARAILGEER